jgi:hypothetical protein
VQGKREELIMKRFVGVFFITMLILSFFFVLSVLGQEKREAENTHTIKQGDTLWGISSKFLNDPFLWPKLWQMNPYITNPHWIYPGQLIRFFPPEKLKEEKPQEVVVEEKPKEVAVETKVEKEEVAPAKKEEPPQVVKKVEVVAETKPTETKPTETKPTETKPTETKPTETKPPEKKPEVFPEVRSAGFVSDINFRGIGIVLDSKEGKYLMSQGDIVYLAFKTAKPIRIGDKFTVFRASEVVRHPVTEQRIGKKYRILGNIQIIDHYGNFFTAEVLEAFDAIYKGDMLKPYM